MKKTFLLFVIILGSTLLFAQNKTQEELLKEKENVVVPPSKGALAVGDDCSDPIVITVGAAPYVFTDLGQTTCGRGNNYSNTDMNLYDGGEDIIYTLVVSEESEVTIEMDPHTASYTGIGLFTGCPAIGNIIAYVANGNTDVRTISQTLAAGTYYIMIDTWPSPNCIGSFDLTVSTPAVPTVPLSNWAFALIGLAALSLVIFKFRK